MTGRRIPPDIEVFVDGGEPSRSKGVALVVWAVLTVVGVVWVVLMAVGVV